MEELSKTRKDAPYGWVLVVGAVVRWIGKAMRGNSGFRTNAPRPWRSAWNKLSSPH